MSSFDIAKETAFKVDDRGQTDCVTPPLLAQTSTLDFDLRRIILVFNPLRAMIMIHTEAKNKVKGREV